MAIDRCIIAPSLTVLSLRRQKMDSNDSYMFLDRHPLLGNQEKSSDYFNRVLLTGGGPDESPAVPPPSIDISPIELTTIKPSPLTRTVKELVAPATITATRKTKSSACLLSSLLDCGEEQVSQAAMDRLDNAQSLFDAVRLEWQTKPGLESKNPYHIRLLSLDCCLVSRCYVELVKYVKRHAGWSVEKRVATRKEMAAAGLELKKRSKYFVDVVYRPLVGV